jgi:hypothetical protein
MLHRVGGEHGLNGVGEKLHRPRTDGDAVLRMGGGMGHERRAEERQPGLP